MGTTFNNGKNKVFDFMEKVAEEQEMSIEDDIFNNSPLRKLRLSNREQEKAKDVCVDNIFMALYKDAVPLNNYYKDAYGSELDKGYHDFVNKMNPKGMNYYIQENPRKNNSRFARDVLEEVDKLVDNKYREKELNIDDVKPEELVFKNDEDNQRRLDVIGKNLSVPEISQAIKDNVTKIALSEITRAKKEKEDNKSLEAELANNPEITSQEAVENAIALKRGADVVNYMPSLFEAIMINKTNKYYTLYENGNMPRKYTYNALSYFTDNFAESTETAGPDELAFIEAVEEYTMWSMLKALKLESFNKYRLRDLADDYASEEF
jgi:hypothetical protein